MDFCYKITHRNLENLITYLNPLIYKNTFTIYVFETVFTNLLRVNFNFCKKQFKMKAHGFFS